MRTLIHGAFAAVALSLLTASLSLRAHAQPDPDAKAPPAQTLITNVRIFNGRNAKLADGMSVLIVGDKIAKISASPIGATAGAAVIDGGNRVLTPGFIDTHTHVTLGIPLNKAATASPLYIGMALKGTLEKMLLRGFTTVRDLGMGADGSVAAAIDEGMVAGPRLFPSGMTISQTGGHGDTRAPYAANPMLDNAVNLRRFQGASILVDGVPEMLAAVRENLKAGATQIKIHAGGGATSDYDPLHTAQFTADEIRAAVEAADNWGTYVVAHAYNDKSIRRLIENGVRQIAHGHQMSDEIVKLAADKGVIVQPDFVWLWADINFAAQVGLKPENIAKVQQILDGSPAYAGLLKKHKIKVAFGTDLVGPLMQYQNKEFTLRSEYWTPAEILIQATGNSYDAIAMCGPLNKYGKFGVIEEGALADILLINGNPLDDIKILENPETSLALIMKDGKIYKNDLK